MNTPQDQIGMADMLEEQDKIEEDNWWDGLIYDLVVTEESEGAE